MSSPPLAMKEMMPFMIRFFAALLTSASLLCVGGGSFAQDSVNFDEGWKFARFRANPEGKYVEVEPQKPKRKKGKNAKINAKTNARGNTKRKTDKKTDSPVPQKITNADQSQGRSNWPPESRKLHTVEFDDSQWRTLNLPHDWAIESAFDIRLPNRSGKLPWPGIGWYRKSFDVAPTDEGKKVFIEFDGAMSGTNVWVNGAWAGEWPYGYSSFRFEITDHLKFGQSNVIAVRLDNKPESSRWYPGGGIYRHVRLVKKNPVHVAQWGVFVATPQISSERATLEIRTELKNNAPDVQVQHEVSELGSAEVLAVCSGTLAVAEIVSPKLWDLDTPHLYQVKTTVLKNGQPVDTETTEFGIRSLEFRTDGFFLNGRKVRINGVCQHSDLGPLGMAVNRRAMQRQIEILQSFGCNAIRTAHNPPDPEFLRLCDRMGMLVQVEAFDTWRREKLVNDYHRFFNAWHQRDLRAMVRRDRNHPSVIMWSTGNEVLEQLDLANTAVVKMLAAILKDEDPTRATTFGCSKPDAAVNGFGASAEVMGINYKPHLYAEIRAKFPDVPLYASETTSSISSRGEYFFPVSQNQREGCGGSFHVSDYGLYASPNGYPADTEFAAQDKHPFVMGEFVWTGFDYIGEPTPYNKDRTNLLNYSDPQERLRVKHEMERLGKNIPPRSSYFGIVDLCGFPKDRYYLYQSRWLPELRSAHILPHWNWPERIGEVTPVHVYTSGDEAELFLNDKSLGRKKKKPFEYRLRWDDVVYQPGVLKVVAYRAGQLWAESTVKTTGAAVGLKLSADRATIAADGEDLSFVTVQVVDSEGSVVPRSDNDIKFTLKGPGEILAIGNGDPTCLEPFKSHQRPVFNGLALVIIRSQKGGAGTLQLKATTEGLEQSIIEITTEK